MDSSFTSSKAVRLCGPTLQGGHGNFCAFVAGPYKTATSLLAARLEASGFVNPASIEGSTERGYGRRVTRYRTRESKTVRKLNEKILTNAFSSPLPKQIVYSSSLRWKREIASYLESFHVPIVIKDPLFCSTLPVWLELTYMVGFLPLVFLTFRPCGLVPAWKHAAYTRHLLRECPDLLDRMVCNSYQLVTYLNNARVPYCLADYRDLVYVQSNPWVHRVSFYEDAILNGRQLRV
jgi:hypothetical protein